jgi:hypothetical protein
MKNRYFTHCLSHDDDKGVHPRRLCYANKWFPNDRFYEGLRYSDYTSYYRFSRFYREVCYEERMLERRFDFFIRQNCFYICKDEKMAILKKHLDENKIPHFKSWRIKRFWKALMSF